jgi:hypothetical protein
LPPESLALIGGVPDEIGVQVAQSELGPLAGEFFQDFVVSVPATEHGFILGRHGYGRENQQNKQQNSGKLFQHILGKQFAFTE